MQPLWHHTEHGNGFPVILGTSYLWDERMWAPQIAALSTRYRVIIPQLPGHGNDVPLDPQASTPADLATHVGHLLDTLDINEWAVVGLSVGGMWAAELALQQPQRVRSMVLMDTSLAAEPAHSQQRYLQMLAAIEHAGHIPEALIDQVVPMFFRPQIPSDDPLPRTLANSLRQWPAQRIATLVTLGRGIFTRPERLDALTALDPQRTWVACGEHDIPRPPEEARTMAEKIGCPLVLIPEAGHIASLENPAAVTELIGSVLA